MGTQLVGMNLAKLLPLRDVADALGVSIHTVRRHIAAGRITIVPVGRRVLVSDREVARIQESGIREATAPATPTANRKHSKARRG